VPCCGSVQVVRKRVPFVKTRVHSYSNPGVVCSGQNDTGTGFTACASVWFCQCYSANGPYSLICHRRFVVFVIMSVVK
jgi:hypothetical protein